MTISAKPLPQVDTAYLDRMLLNREGKFHLMPAADVKRLDHEHLQVWCHRRTRYNIPTVELVEFVKRGIDGRTALEIGAGMGDFGRHLGIPMTDSHMQTLPEMQALMAQMGQPPLCPPEEVEKLDGVEAVTKYKPQVVVAAWVTQLYQEGDDVKQVGSCIGGVDEEWLLDHCETLIFVGNEHTHRDKRILRHPHATLKPWYLVSRAFDQSKNVIWIWGKQ